MAAVNDLTSKKFGKLTVLEPTDQRENRYMVWKCRCECGGIVFVSSKKLVRGTIQSCGCDSAKIRSHGKPAEDISGQRFGKLTAIKRVPSQNGRTMWLCKCDCGNEKIAEKHRLKSGRIKSCGCLKQGTAGAPYKDITGQTFGRLTAIEPTKRRDCKGSVYWRCKCECGNEAEVTADCLINGNTVSCGCRKQEINSKINQTLTFVDGTCVDYLRSRKSRSDNKSGFRGVYQINDKYRVTIGFQGRRYYLGTFHNFEEAVVIRKEAEREIHDQFVEIYDWWVQKAIRDPEWGEEHPIEFNVEAKDGEVRVDTPLIAEMRQEKILLKKEGGMSDVCKVQADAFDAEESRNPAVPVLAGSRVGAY